jgi:hypothetical protein
VFLLSLACNTVFTLQPIVPSTAAFVDADETNANAIQICLLECRVLVFKSVFRLDQIGHHNLASTDHLPMTALHLCNLTFKFNTRGISVGGSPDMLFDKHFLALIPLLPATLVNFWGVALFTQFWHALGKMLTC